MLPVELTVFNSKVVMLLFMHWLSFLLFYLGGVFSRCYVMQNSVSFLNFQSTC